METQNEKIEDSKTNLEHDTQSGSTYRRSTTNSVAETSGNTSTASVSDAGSNGLLHLRKAGSAGGKATGSQSSSVSHHAESLAGGPGEKSEATNAVKNEMNSAKKHTDASNDGKTNVKSNVKTKFPPDDETTETITDKSRTTSARASPPVAMKRAPSPVGSRPGTPLDKIPRTLVVNTPPINQLSPLPPIKPNSPPEGKDALENTPSDSESTPIGSQNCEDLTNTPERRLRKIYTTRSKILSDQGM